MDKPTDEDRLLTPRQALTWIALVFVCWAAVCGIIRLVGG